MSLLDKAVKATRANGIGHMNKEHYDLAVAYFQGQVTHNQVAKALEVNPSSVAHYMSKAMREAIANGYIQLTVKKVKG